MFDDSGNIVPGGLLETYLAGTSTPATTYSNVGLTVANANPVVMDAAGRATIFLTPGVSYKYIAKTAASVTLWTRDNIAVSQAQDVDITVTAGESLTAGNCVYVTNGTGVDAARTAGRFYKADQTFSERSATAIIVGFATANITSGATGTVRIAGLVTGLSALTPGATYWISTTPGVLTSSSQASVGGRAVGIADPSTTALILFPQQAPAPWATTHTDTTNIQGIVATAQQTWSGLKILGGSYRDTLLTAFIAADVTNDTAVLANLTGLSITLTSGQKYAFELVLQISNTTAADGFLMDFDGGAATMTNFRCAGVLTRETGAVVTMANAVSVALATDINVAALASTSQHCLRINGSLEPSSSSTFIPRVAMNADTGGTLSIHRGSYIRLFNMP